MEFKLRSTQALLEFPRKAFVCRGLDPISPPLPKAKWQQGFDALVPNEGVASSGDIHEYQSKVGSVLYAIIHTRPDAAHIVPRLAQFMANPSKTHLAAANHCIQYLDGSRDRCLLFDGRYEGNTLEVLNAASRTEQ